MKPLFYLLMLLTLLSCSLVPNRNPAAVSSHLKPRHIIITVHGISGNELTWGYFAPTTEKYLEKIDPNYDVVVSNFLYPTGQNEKLTTYEFAQLLDQHIKALTTNLGKDDKISIVAHSQGGIVSYIWFFNQILKEQDPTLLQHVDSIITLGTPFWGSKLASILTDKRRVDVIDFVKMLGGENYRMTRREITDMAFGSDTVHDFRKIAIQLDNDERYAKILKSLPTRLINMTGIMPKDRTKILANANGPQLGKFVSKLIDLIYSKFARKGFGSGSDSLVVESDIAVIVPSSRWDFIYSTPKVVSNETVIRASDFKGFNHLVDRSKFFFSETVHLPFDNENTLSMAYINKSCETVETCNHPTYGYILNQLANCKENSCDRAEYSNILEKMTSVNKAQYEFNKELSEKLRAFDIQIGIKLKPGQIQKFPVQYFQKRYTNEEMNLDIWQLNEPGLIGKVIDLHQKKNQVSEASNEQQTVYIGRKSESQSVDVTSKNASAEGEFDHLRINVTGAIVPKVDGMGKQAEVPIDINLPGLPKVQMKVLVKPGYSTYIELDYTK